MDHPAHRPPRRRGLRGTLPCCLSAAFVLVLGACTTTPGATGDESGPQDSSESPGDGGVDAPTSDAASRADTAQRDPDVSSADEPSPAWMDAPGVDGGPLPGPDAASVDTAPTLPDSGTAREDVAGHDTAVPADVAGNHDAVALADVAGRDAVVRADTAVARDAIVLVDTSLARDTAVLVDTGVARDTAVLVDTGVARDTADGMDASSGDDLGVPPPDMPDLDAWSPDAAVAPDVSMEDVPVDDVPAMPDAPPGCPVRVSVPRTDPCAAGSSCGLPLRRTVHLSGARSPLADFQVHVVLPDDVRVATGPSCDRLLFRSASGRGRPTGSRTAPPGSCGSARRPSTSAAPT